jgi:enoyl-CoA hydratase
VSDEPVLVERRGPVALVTFNRPEKLNAISSGMLDRLEAVLEELGAGPEVRAVVLTGAGPRAFVAGADVDEYAGQSREAFIAYQRRSRALFSRLDAFPKPVIGAVNGYALGGGFEIALCCDVLVASTNARFGLPEGLLGLSPGGGGTQRLTRAVGPFVASDVLLATRRLTAEEALGLGLVSEVVEPDVLVDAAMEKALTTARVAPLASREMKRLIAVALDEELDSGLTVEQEALIDLFGTRDAAEGIRAFVEKREPRFEGS